QPASKVSQRGQVWSLLQVPLLAFSTALAVGGIIIALTDLQVLGQLYDALGRLQVAGYVALALAVLVAALALAVYFDTERMLQRLVWFKPFANHLLAARLIALVAGSILVYLLLLVAGFGATLDRANSAVVTAYAAMAEGSLGNPVQM